MREPGKFRVVQLPENLDKPEIKRRVVQALFDTIAGLSSVESRLRQFLESNMWATEDYATSYAQGFAAYASIARVRLQAVREVRELLDSGWLDDTSTLNEVLEEVREQALGDLQERIAQAIQLVKRDSEQKGGD